VPPAARTALGGQALVEPDIAAAEAPALAAGLEPPFEELTAVDPTVEPTHQAARPEARAERQLEPRLASGSGREALPAERSACTAPQLRRFIKSRAYVPMHELRRRFAIDSAEDDVTPVDLETHRVYVGLPEREGRMLGELLRGGDVGFELSLDPITPIVVGVYPMRPVPRA
jgi:hypothetical protein